MNYTVGDFLIRIKNAYLARKTEVELPNSKENSAICEILVAKNYLKSFEKKERKGHKILAARLLYKERKPAISNIKLISKPSVHVYVPKNRIPKTLRGIGITVLSTNKGLMTDREAREKKIGGEIICQIY